MASPVLVGIDVGTTSMKVVATDVGGCIVAAASAEYSTSTDRGASAEQSADDWIRALASLIPRLLEERRPLAVAVTSQAPTLVAVDHNWHPLAPALTWLDRRAIGEARRIAEIAPGHRNGADPFFGTAKIPWLLARCGEVSRKGAYVLAANGFVAAFLTGIAALDDTTASLMQGFDERTDAFDRRLFGQNLGIELLPEIVKPTKIIGSVTRSAAAATGLPSGTPVVAGAIDAVGSALEAGALTPGDPFVEMSGFSSVAFLPVPAGTVVPDYIHARHAIPDVDLLISAQVTAGATIDWVNSLDRATDLRNFSALGRVPRPSHLTFVPSLAGERTPTWNPTARGILDGIDLTTTAADIMVSAMEGVALALGHDIDMLSKRGFTIERLLCTGGGASSSLWLEIKADVTGLTVQRPRAGHGAAQGAAYLAGLATGAFTDLDELRKLGNEIVEQHEPDEGRHRLYQEKQKRFNQVAILNASPRPTLAPETGGTI